MNLRQLRHFLVVADHLHFTRAAEALGIAQPALSQSIRALERSLNVTLFRRSKRSVELTEYGEALVPRAQALLRNASLALEELHEIAGAARGRVRVGASGTLAAFVLPELVAAFRRLHPNVVLEIVQRRSEAILALVEAGELDLGLVRLPLRPTDAHVTRLFEEPLYAVLPPDHPCATHQALALSKVRADPFIMPVRPHEAFYKTIEALCQDQGFSPRVIAAGAEYTTVFRLVGMGLGISVVSEQGTKLDVEPTPAFVRIDDERARSPVVLVERADIEPSKGTMAFRSLTIELTGPDHRNGATP